MVYHAGEMLLEPIGEFLHGKVNDVLVCRDLRSPIGATYILLLIHDRGCTKRILKLLEDSEKVTAQGERPYLMRFTQNEQLGLVFRYQAERKLSTFGEGQMVTQVIRESICINLIIECLSTAFPFPMLYLILTQDCISLEKDNSVYFIPNIDLARLDGDIDESACATAAAQLSLELLNGNANKRGKKKIKSYELLRKKLSKRAYGGFTELYQDIRLTAIRHQRRGFMQWLKSSWELHKDTIFHVLFAICIAAVGVSLVFVVCQMVFGDIPFLRFFERAFEIIGTETLTK